MIKIIIKKMIVESFKWVKSLVLFFVGKNHIKKNKKLVDEWRFVMWHLVEGY